VLVEGGHIREVSDRPIKSATAKMIDLAGRTLMPGLIDAHVHVLAVDMPLARLSDRPVTLLTLRAAKALEGMLLRGFTTIRDAGGAARSTIAPREQGRLYCFSSGNMYALSLAGVARAMITDFTDLATEKVPRRARQRLCENQVIQSQQAQAEPRLGACLSAHQRQGDLGSGRRNVRTEPGAEHDDPSRLDLRHRPGLARSSTPSITAMARQRSSTNRPFERRFRDMHAASQQARERQAHYETTDRVLFGLAPDTVMFAF
jgi:hypothetical protein